MAASRHDAALAITGMTCAACVSRIEKVLLRRPGVVSATVSLPAERAEIAFDPDRTSLAELVEAVEDAGYGARPLDDGTDSQAGAAAAAELRATVITLAVAAVLTLPLVAGMVLMLVGSPWRVPPWLQLALATPVQFWAGARFYRGAWGALKGGGANMDVLVALGTTAAYGLSLFLVVTGSHASHGHLYFEAAALVITLVMAGKYLETRARRATNQAVEALIALRPETARVIAVDGGETVVGLEKLRRGDLVAVRPGERIPADGVVVEGRAAVDEAMVTGESLPQERGQGATVTGGTVNLDGFLKIQVAAIGAEAVLGRLIALVGHAQATKPRIQRLADTVAGWFAFFVLAVALLTLAAWLIGSGRFEPAILAAVSVLVVACPCALGLATPAVIAVALGAGARRGILIRDAEALESAYAVSVVVFDKTGTLTESRPELTDVVALDGDQTGLIRAAASIQHAASHPIARAVLEHAAGLGIQPLEVAAFRAEAGRGVRGTVGGRDLAMGNRAYMKQLGIPLAPLGPQVGTLERQGKAVVWIGSPGETPALVGLLGLADRLRPNAAQAVAALKRLGVTTVLLTGDAPAAAQATARRLGIERVIAGARPEDKIAEIERLQAAHEIVAMVGDGVNDGPALARANLGIAMGGGTDVALQAAAVGLIRDDPALVAGVLDLARAARRKIIQNLVWAFGFNTVAIPLAAVGLLGPVPAAIGMTVSSLAVVGNALALRRWQPGRGAAAGDKGKPRSGLARLVMPASGPAA
ncbi:MAG: heavy metal translocating P-type ATPase [Azospirillum sp.]|nr:heavy metal translocating P-type ATPase [Azospirillum sp.]